MNAILTYHSIDPSGSPISVSPAAFRRQIGHLLAARIRVVTVEALLSGATSGADAVALTFDDGFVSVAEEAVPLLVEHGLPATVFVVSGCVGGTNRWTSGDGYGVPDLPLLGWDALERMVSQGLTIGSHTRTHPRLPTLGASQLDDEIAGAAHDLDRRLGPAPRGFAYPYGEVAGAVRSAVGRTHRWACTTEFRTLDEEALDLSRLDLPRLDMWYFERPGRFEQWGTQAFARWVRRRRRLRQVRAAWRRVGGS